MVRLRGRGAPPADERRHEARVDPRGAAARDGGIVVVPNHISHIDPLVVAHYLYDNGRLPRFLAKAIALRRLLRPPGAARCPADPGVPREPRRRGRVPGRRRGRAGGGVRRRLRRGHLDPRPAAVADGGQDRRGADRARHRLPGAPHGDVGAAGPARAVRQVAARLAAPAHAGDARASRSTSPTCSASRDPGRAARRPPSGSWTP